MRGYHDVGGHPEGPIDRSQHELAYWEKQVDAMLSLLCGPARAMRVDELRRGIESLGADAYRRLGYYERWIASISNILVEKGILQRHEIDARIEAIHRKITRETTP